MKTWEVSRCWPVGYPLAQEQQGCKRKTHLVNFCRVDVDSGTNMGMVLLCLKQMFSHRCAEERSWPCGNLPRPGCKPVRMKVYGCTQDLLFLNPLPFLSSSTGIPPTCVSSQVQTTPRLLGPLNILPKSKEGAVARKLAV